MPDARPPDRLAPPGRVGIVGGGQLARMTCEAASALGIPITVLVEREDDAAVAVAPDVLVGAPTDERAIDALARRCSVVTFDHEQVDVAQLASLERSGVAVRPGTVTLQMAVDKAVMRRRLSAAGVRVPEFALLGGPRLGVELAADSDDDAGDGAAGDGAGSDGAAGDGAAGDGAGSDGAGRADHSPRDGARGGAVDPADGDRVDADAMAAEVTAFATAHGWPVVLKATRGGYDGKGVWVAHDPAGAAEVCRQAALAGVRLLVEEHVEIDAELAVLVVRRPNGDSATWPAVQTVQDAGVCREVLLPGCLDPALAARAETLGREVAAVAEATGVLAVEMFLSDGQLLVNEVAARPHNSGHWTIEGAVTSQFENHLRAVLDLPLGSTAPTSATVASVNVFGAADGTDPAAALDGALAVGGAHVHLYGKPPRPGRKLGHVTVCGQDPPDVRTRAWRAACALGTPLLDAAPPPEAPAPVLVPPAPERPR